LEIPLGPKMCISQNKSFMMAMLYSIILFILMFLMSGCASVPYREIAEAELSLQRAQKIEAPVYSPELYLEAQRKFIDAKSLLQKGKYGDAKSFAQKAKLIGQLRSDDLNFPGELITQMVDYQITKSLPPKEREHIRTIIGMIVAREVALQRHAIRAYLKHYDTSKKIDGQSSSLQNFN